MSTKIPIIINNRDLYTWPKAMVSKIVQYDNVGQIIIVDNGSTYKPLLKWYKEQKLADVLYCENLGHAGAWISRAVEQLGSEYYVVTDSDLGIDNTPNDSLKVMLEKLKTNPSIQKVGFGLDWKMVNKESPYYNRLNMYEKDRWDKSNVINNVYVDVPIDTTFAMYNVQNYFIGGGSLTYPYVARHYPWELSIDHSNNEFKYYIKNASSSCSYKMIVPTT